MIIEAREDTIILRGAVTTNIWPAIQAVAALLLRNNPKGIIIDSSAVNKVTARGAQTFEDAFEYIHAHEANILVAGLAPDMLEIVKAVPGARSQLPIASSVEEARSSLQLQEITPERGRARLAAVVPILGDWGRAVYHTDRLALGESCEVHLVDFIRVPLTLPLGSPQPEREAAGQERLEAASAQVRQMELQSFSHVERARSYANGLSQYMEQLKGNFSVVSIDRGQRGDPYIEEDEALSLVDSAQFEVSLVKGAPEDTGSPILRPAVPAVGDWRHALEHTCKLASRDRGEITVIYMIPVPRTQPIDVSMPDADAAAADCRNEATRIARRYSQRVNVIVERVRDPILAFLKMLGAGHYDLSVVGVRRQPQGDDHVARAMARSLLQELPTEVVFLRTGRTGR